MSGIRICTYRDMGNIFKPVQPRDMDRGYSCKFNCKGAILRTYNESMVKR